jgi:transcriptional regulatory protein GAL4
MTFQSLSAQTTSLPAEVSYTTIYTPLICQTLFHAATNDLHHRLISTPGPLPRELIALNRTIDAWEKSIPSYFQLEEITIQLNETFLFARYRLSWRTWNLKILLSRPVVFTWRLKRGMRMKAPVRTPTRKSSVGTSAFRVRAPQ